MADKKLGRGLDFLISEDATLPGDEVFELEIGAIAPNPRQPRREFSDDALKELAASIREHGVLQPIVVRQGARGYEIIAGERRWRASQLARLETIPAIVRRVDDSKMLELALIENVQREDLNPIEKAVAFRDLMQRLGLTQDQVAERIAKSRASVANLVRLLELPSEIQDCVVRGSLSMGHARALLGLRGADVQLELCKQLVRDNLSVRETERAVQRRNASSAPERSVTGEARQQEVIEAQVQSLEQQIRSSTGLRVRIHPRGRGGRVVLRYGSAQEFERLFARLTGSRPVS